MRKLLENIDGAVAFEKSAGNVLDEAHWGNQHGLLISVDDAEKLVKLGMATESLLFMMGELEFNSYGAKTLDDAINKVKALYK